MVVVVLAWLNWVLWHIKHFRLFYAKSLSINIYDLFWLGFMAYQFFFIHIYQIYMIWFSLVLWHINPYR